MLELNRGFTNKINWIFDNLLPPIVRDNKFFMSPFFYILFGSKRQYFFKFKELAPFLTKSELEEHYAFLADKHINRKTDLNHQSISKVLDSITGNSVLDVGCGRGFLASLIAKTLGKQVTGLDFYLPTATENSTNPRFIAGNAEELPFPDNSFDTVICSHTLEHTQNIDRAVQELRRVARFKLIVVVPRQREFKYTFDLHLHFFPYISSLKRVMQRRDAQYIILDNDLFYCEEIDANKGADL